MSHIIHVDTPLDLSFVFSLQNFLRDKTELFYEKRTPQLSPALHNKESILAQVEKKDVLLSYPFESMKPFLRMLQEAAEDDSVVRQGVWRLPCRSSTKKSGRESAICLTV